MRRTSTAAWANFMASRTERFLTVLAGSSASPGIPAADVDGDHSAASPGPVMASTSCHDVEFAEHLRTVGELEHALQRADAGEARVALLEGLAQSWLDVDLESTTLWMMRPAIRRLREETRVALAPDRDAR